MKVFEDEEIIFAYTRQQAIEDGTLVDVTETAREARFKCPVALTAAVWAEYVRVPEAVHWQDEQGRLWDILTMLLHGICRDRSLASELIFQVLVQNTERKPSLVSLKSVAGPDDDGELCLTVMLPDED